MDKVKALGQWVVSRLVHFWLPLAITGSLLGVAVTVTAILLYKQQITVQIANLPVREQGKVTAKRVGLLSPGEHLQIIGQKNKWYHVRREDESTGWVASWLVERKKPLAKVTPLSETTIALDAGHGGSDTGALSNQDQYEKDYTLALARRVKTQLEKRGARVIMIRNQDVLVPLAQIPQQAEAKHADLFLSFHFDSAPEKNSASGYTTYYYHQENGSKELANAVNQALQSRLPNQMHNKGIAFGDYLVLRDNDLPAILLENGYINSDKDFKRIKSSQYQEQIARAIPLGLDHYLSQQMP